MWKISRLLGLMFMASSLVFCFGHQDNFEGRQLKTTLIEDIVRKVCNISLNTFSNKSSEEKEYLLTKIEEKLTKSAKSLRSHGEKYVNLILKVVRSKAFGIKSDEISDNKKYFDNKNLADTKKSAIISRKVSGHMIKKNKHSHTRTKSKDELINDIARKLEVLAKTYLKNVKTKEERDNVIENIKQKLIKSTAQNEYVANTLVHNKHDDVKSYVDLVAKGIVVMLHHEKGNNKLRKMTINNTNAVFNKQSRESSIEFYKPPKVEKPNNNDIDQGDNLNLKELKSIFFKTNTHNTLKIKSPCEEALEETCKKIKFVQKFQCEADNSEIHIVKLCDGIGDCLDYSDEQNCAKNAIETIQNANLLMKYIDTSLSGNCYSNVLDENLVSKQNTILNNVLQNQLSFLHSHSLEGTQYSRRVFDTDTQTNRKIVNDAVTVVNTLSRALETSLCSNFTANKDKTKLLVSELRTGIDTLDKNLAVQLADVIPARTWSPEICKCHGNRCTTKCPTECELICWRKFSLSQWQCSAVDGNKSVSLDMLCDGKLDCFDESDENECTRDIGLAKFEAIKTYDFILQLIQTKSVSVHFKPIRSKMQLLLALVEKLQKISIARYPEVTDIKNSRETCFAELMAIYDTALHHMKSPNELLDMYVFLLSLNERLVRALKRSHTGNDKIISPDGCICRSNKCAMIKCTKACTRACIAEPMLTKYFCGGSSEINDSVPIDFICNGKKNCPDGDDESNCRQEVCRKHHLIVLRHNLRNAGDEYRGTALGEAVKSWRVKVMATLMVAESNERPKPYHIREIVSDVQRDLVMTYASLDDSRRSGDAALNEFVTWSRVVMNTLKSCTK